MDLRLLQHYKEAACASSLDGIGVYQRLLLASDCGQTLKCYQYQENVGSWHKRVSYVEKTLLIACVSCELHFCIVSVYPTV